MPSLGEAISGLLKEQGLEDTVRLHQAVNLWAEVVGPVIARNCRAVQVKGRTLFVKVGSAAWRNELAFQKDDILQAINEKIGTPILKDVRFI